jgi:hypothetical protein
MNPFILKPPRKDLSTDSLLQRLRSRFDAIPDIRSTNAMISLSDTLMAAFAMFLFKDPSLLAFEKRSRTSNGNFRTIFGIANIPCDTQMRTILDRVDPNYLRSCYRDIFRCLQRGKALEPFVFMNNCYLISLDGTEYFSSTSDNIHCPSCLKKRNRVGVVTHYHQFLGAALVHPDRKEVIPLAPEPIINADGNEKNDCERNATRRWLKKFRQEHPHLLVIIIEDSLAANAPHLSDLRAAHAGYIIGVKPGSHAFLFQHLYANDEAGRTQTATYVDPSNGILHHFRYHHDVPLNESNPEELVKVLEYWEISPQGEVKHFSWISEQDLTSETVYDIMLGGRCRWKIENETFNTLKNQGYHLEHNYGHGHLPLSVVLLLLMMLAFLVDQVQQLSDPQFQAAWRKSGTKRYLWEQMRTAFAAFVLGSMAELLKLLIKGFPVRPPEWEDTS